VAGPAGKGGIGKNGFANTIGGKVVVPSHCWKVILVLDKNKGKDDDVQRVRDDTRLIAVIMPNVRRVTDDWTDYRTTVKKVENLTGHRFFSAVPDDVIGPLKEVVDDMPVKFKQPPHSTHRKGNQLEPDLLLESLR
jgi:endonuclease G